MEGGDSFVPKCRVHGLTLAIQQATNYTVFSIVFFFFLIQTISIAFPTHNQVLLISLWFC